jgi:hypothetical protein
MHEPGEAGRGDPERQRNMIAKHGRAGVDLGHVTQNRRVKLDVSEGLPGTAQRQLLLGGAVGVVERRFRGAPLGDSPQIFDRQRGVESPRRRAQARLAELKQRRQFAWSRKPSLHRTPPRTIRRPRRALA